MKKVLVVEDDKKIALALEIRLRSLGIEPILAFDAVMGINAAKQHHPDIIIMDIMMPAGNGLDIAKKIKNMSDVDIPVIFITASKKYMYQDEAIRFGAAGFFEKPYDANKLLGKVAELI